MSPSDTKSREILKKMIDEEEEHGKEAKDHGEKSFLQ